MKQIFSHFILTIILTALCFTFALAQLNEDGRWQTDLYYEPLNLNYKYYSETDFHNTIAKLEVIKSQTLFPRNDTWAGDYVILGNLSASVFRWSPDAGFVQIGAYTCIPELRYLNYGSVTATPKYLTTTSLTTKQKEPVTKFVRVKWGEQRYLIQENRIAEFYSYLAGYNDDGTDYINEGYFWVHKDDAEKPFAGMPIFPAGYERFVKKSIQASVTQVLRKEIKAVEFNENEGVRDEDGNITPYYESQTFVKLNAGSANGVKRGMGFNPISTDSYGWKLKIVSVDKHSSTGVITLQLGEAKQEDDSDLELLQMFKVGAKLSTSSIFQQLKN